MPSSWRNSSWYGRKEKNRYKRLDNLINKLFDTAETQGTDIEPLLIDQIVKLTSKGHGSIHSVTKLTETMDIVNRMQSLEDIIVNVDPSALSAAKVKHELQKQYR